MSRFSFSLADKNDDAELRRMMAENILPGNISVSFRREPSYFNACNIQGNSYEIIKCVDTDNKKIIGVGSRFLYDAYINGEKKYIGYLGDLRAEEKYRRKGLLAAGYSFLKKLHTDNPVPFYTTMIWEGNEEALNILTSKRAGLPVYKPMGRFLAPAIHLDLPKKKIKIPGVSFEKGSKKKIPQIFGFINECYKQKQFAPYYVEEDFNTSKLLGLKAEDFYLAIRDNKVIGVIAAWDQTSFRQTHIEKYSSGIRVIKPFYNMAARFSPLKPLLDEGSKVPFFYISHIAIKGDNPEIFRALLRGVYCDRRQGYWHYFICGLHEHDPLSTILNEYRSIKAGGHLFCVHYPGDEHNVKSLDGRVPYIEAATL